MSVKLTPEQWDGLVDLIRAIARDEAARIVQAPGDVDPDEVADRVRKLFVEEPDEPESPLPDWEVVSHPHKPWMFALHSKTHGWQENLSGAIVAYAKRKYAKRQIREMP